MSLVTLAASRSPASFFKAVLVAALVTATFLATLSMWTTSRVTSSSSSSLMISQLCQVPPSSPAQEDGGKKGEGQLGQLRARVKELEKKLEEDVTTHQPFQQEKCMKKKVGTK